MKCLNRATQKNPQFTAKDLQDDLMKRRRRRKKIPLQSNKKKPRQA